MKYFFFENFFEKKFFQTKKNLFLHDRHIVKKIWLVS